MSTITITDTCGDELEVGYNADDGLVIENPDRSITDWAFDQAEAQRLVALLPTPSVATPVSTPQADTANEAKLRLAAQYGLRVKFDYTGEGDIHAHARRVEPDVAFVRDGVLYVGGESFDSDGDTDGYRQFRLDRISGKVVVR